MSAHVSQEQARSPEQLEIAGLTLAAQGALEFRNPSSKPLEDGGTKRELWGGNEQVICDLSETTPTSGPKAYTFGFPYIIKVNGSPELVGLEAQWSEDDTRTAQRISVGSEEARSLADFDGPTVENISRILNIQLGDPANTPRKSHFQNLKKKLGRLATH